MSRIGLGLVGLGKIATDQHVPAIAKGSDFDLVAVASRNATLEGVANYTDIDAMLTAQPDVEAVALCMPPGPRYKAAYAAIAAGKHVLLEKPPGGTVSEVLALAAHASRHGVVLFATWHSRYAAAVESAKKFLQTAEILSVRIDWREDVRHWHPKQRWVWEPAGLGVFDPGINALSIMTEILPDRAYLSAATLDVPENCAMPIGAELHFSSERGYAIDAIFDWRQTGPQTWDISVETSQGRLVLSQGGTRLTIAGKAVKIEAKLEYEALYDRFARLLRTGTSDVDLAPLQHVADAFMLGSRKTVAPFHDD